MITEYYKSTKDFFSTINNRLTQRFYKKYIASNSIVNNSSDRSFYGTSSYEESLQFAEKGDLSNFSKIKNAQTKIKSKENEFVCKMKNILQPVGGVPVVPLALKGVPNCFLSRVKSKVPAKNLNLGIFVGVPCFITADEIIKYNSYIASFVNILEKNDVRVNLFFCKQCYPRSTNEDLQTLVIKLKSAEQPLNLLKLSYWLVNPSANRRQGFRWIETLPGGYKDPNYGLSVTINNYKKPDLKIDMKCILLNDLIKKGFGYEETIKYLQKTVL